MGSNIMCGSVLRSATIYSEDTMAGLPFINAVSGSTALQAGFDSGASRDVILDLGAVLTFSSLGIAKHNLYDAISNIDIYTGTAVDGAWTIAHTFSPSSNDVHYKAFTAVTSQFIKLTITSSASNIYIGNLTLGTSLEIGDGQYTGFVQPDYAPTHKLIANVTRGGEIAGIMRQATPVRAKIEARHVRKSWLDANWYGLNDCMTKYPFYFLWEDAAAPLYCWARKIIPPTWTTINRLKFSIDAEGFL